jgi:uncharacterized membrane protein (UPF0127 family)
LKVVKSDKIISTAIEIEQADSFLKRLKGLMFKKMPITETGLHLKPCDSIHMFFMRFPIDVVFLNENNQIVKAVPAIQPWKMIFPVKGAVSAVELPEGTIRKYAISEGEKIEFT